MNAAPHTPLKACYFPAFESADDLARYKTQALWHLAPLKDKISIVFSQDAAEIEQSAKQADIIFYWQKEAYWAAKAAHRRKGLVVDEYAQQAVGDHMDAFVARYITPDYSGHSEAFFKRVRARRTNINRTMIVGSGPDMASLKKLTAEDLKTSITLYLSTSVLNEGVCSVCPPDIIIAVDGCSQFGLSETGMRYRQRAVELIRQYDSLMLVPAQHLPSIRAHWPEDIQGNIFAVPLTRKVKPGHSFHQAWEYEPTSNVLTSFGLPCAASFSKIICFAGVSLGPEDTAVNADTHHWEHIDEALYQRHIASMLACHPASGQEDGDYLTRHHNRLKQELAAYAANGVSFSKLNQAALPVQPVKSAPITSQKLPARIRFFEAIAKIEHFPSVIIASVFIMAGLLGMSLEYSIGLPMLGFIIAGGVAACLVAGVLFLRLRQNRMHARLESKLSQQQTQQFANLSERLEALERKK